MPDNIKTKKSRKKRIAVTAISILLGTILLYNAFMLLWGNAAIMSLLAHELQQNTGLEMQYSRGKFELFPRPGLKISGLQIGRTGAQPLFSLKSLYITVDMGKFLHGQLAFETLVLQHPTITLLRSGDGSNNWQSTGDLTADNIILPSAINEQVVAAKDFAEKGVVPESGLVNDQTTEGSGDTLADTGRTEEIDGARELQGEGIAGGQAVTGDNDSELDQQSVVRLFNSMYERLEGIMIKDAHIKIQDDTLNIAFYRLSLDMLRRDGQIYCRLNSNIKLEPGSVQPFYGAVWADTYTSTFIAHQNIESGQEVAEARASGQVGQLELQLKGNGGLDIFVRDNKVQLLTDIQGNLSTGEVLFNNIRLFGQGLSAEAEFRLHINASGAGFWGNVNCKQLDLPLYIDPVRVAPEHTLKRLSKISGVFDVEMSGTEMRCTNLKASAGDVSLAGDCLLLFGDKMGISGTLKAYNNEKQNALNLTSWWNDLLTVQDLNSIEPYYSDIPAIITLKPEDGDALPDEKYCYKFEIAVPVLSVDALSLTKGKCLVDGLGSTVKVDFSGQQGQGILSINFSGYYPDQISEAGAYHGSLTVKGQRIDLSAWNVYAKNSLILSGLCDFQLNDKAYDKLTDVVHNLAISGNVNKFSVQEKASLSSYTADKLNFDGSIVAEVDPRNQLLLKKFDLKLSGDNTSFDDLVLVSKLDANCNLSLDNTSTYAGGFKATGNFKKSGWINSTGIPFVFQVGLKSKSLSELIHFEKVSLNALGFSMNSDQLALSNKTGEWSATGLINAQSKDPQPLLQAMGINEIMQNAIGKNIVFSVNMEGSGRQIKLANVSLASTSFPAGPLSGHADYKFLKHGTSSLRAAFKAASFKAGNAGSVVEPNPDRAKVEHDQGVWDLAWFKKSDFAVQVAVEDFEFYGVQLSGLAVNLGWASGNITDTSLKTSIGSGSGSLVVRGGIVETPFRSLDLQLYGKLEEAELEKFISELSGTINLDAELHGNFQKDADIPAALGGIWSLKARQRKSSGDRDFKLMTASGKVENGVVSTDNIILVIDNLKKMNAKASINLMDMSLDLHGNAVMANLSSTPISITGNVYSPKINISQLGTVPDTLQYWGTGLFSTVGNILSLPGRALDAAIFPDEDSQKEATD